MKKTAPPLAYTHAPQIDFVAGSAGHCPTCGGVWKGAVRVCRCCGQVIGKGHKYRFVPAGPGVYALEHRNCAEPTKRT